VRHLIKRIVIAATMGLVSFAAFGEHQVVSFDSFPLATEDHPQEIKSGPAKLTGGEVVNLFANGGRISFAPWSTHQCYFTHNVDHADNIVIPAHGFTSQIRIEFTRRASHISFDLGNFLYWKDAAGPIVNCSTCLQYRTVRFDIIDDHNNTYTRALTGDDLFNSPTPAQTQHIDFPFDNVKYLTITPRGTDVPSLKWNWGLTNLEYDARDTERFTIKVDGETDAESAFVAQDLKAELPLGTRFDLSFERRQADGTWTTVTSGFRIGEETVKPPLLATLNDAAQAREPLFPETVVFPYDATVSATTKTFQVVHKGDATLTVTPSDAKQGDDPIKLQISIGNPTSLGVPDAPLPFHNGRRNDPQARHFDDEIVKRAHSSGLPPQWIKAQIDQETGDTNARVFDPFSLRYEPFSRDYALIERAGFFARQFPRAPRDAQPPERYSDFQLPNGALLCRPGSGPCGGSFSDLDDFEPPHRRGYLYCDNGSSVLVPSFGVYPTARQYVQSNVYPRPPRPPGREWPISEDPSPQPDCADKLPPRTPNPNPGRSHAVRFPSDVMTFTAQTDLGSSFGLLQMIYVDMVGEQFFWTGYNGRKNPSLLFDTDENIARANDADARGQLRGGGTSLKFGVMRDVWIYHVVENGVPDDPLVFHRPAEFDEQLRLGIDLYNGGHRGYGQSVFDRVSGYLPQRDRSQKIFVAGLCGPLAVTAQTTNVTVEPGSAATLSVDINSTVPAIYDWYLDTNGGSQRISGAEGSVVVHPTVTSTYHAVASTSCGTVTSQPITVNVAAACIPALISDPTVTLAPTTATLAISASGSALSYSWFLDPQDLVAGTFTPQPTVGTGPSITVGRQVTPVSYRALVQNACGFVTSAAITVPAIGNCTPIASDPSPASSSVTVGTVVEIVVVGAGSNLTYQWFVGQTGDASHPIAGASNNKLVVTAQSSATYWVRVASNCGSADSASARIDVTQTCVPPSIVASPQAVSLVAGSTATLAVEAAGTAPLRYAWYEGVSGDRSRPLVLAGSTIAVAPLQSTSFWVEVANDCGSAPSATVPVTVTNVCVPPAIVTSPPSQTLVSGHSVTLTVTATGTGLSYQWYLGDGNQGSAIPGATSAAITVAPQTASTYWVSVKNTCGNAASVPATLTVLTSCTPPSITSAAALPPSVLSGQSAQVVVSASGTAPFTYQWYVGSFPDASTPVPGATGASVTVSPATTTSYWARVENACGNASSASATVTVSSTCIKPVITSDIAASTTLISGQSAQFSVAVFGDAPLSYQWYLGTAPDITTPLAGQSQATLSIAPTTSASYWVRVSNGCGTADSGTAVVTVLPCIPVHITREPISITIPPGVQEFLGIGADGTQPITFQWYIGISGDRSQPIPGATISALPVSPTETTSYWADVINACGTQESSAATVVVLPACTAPSVTQDPASVTITDGSSATLTVAGSGSDPLSYQWFVGNVGDETSPVPGATAPSVSVSPHSTTSYWVEITNSCGLTMSAAAIVTVNPVCSAPVITAQPAAASITFGSTSTLSVAADGTAPLSYQWYIGATGDLSTPVAGATASSAAVAPAATTSYWVQITNSCGSIGSTAASISVTQSCVPAAITGPPASTSITLGDSTTLLVSAAGTAPLSYQWYVGSAGDTSQPVAGATGASLLVSPGQTTNYWVRAANGCGTADSPAATVTVVVPCNPPSISSQPLSQSIAVGGTATLTITATGNDPFGYQWYTGTSGDTSAPIASASAASITVSPAATATYWSRVTNSCGSTDSDTATVTVHDTCLGGGCGPGGGPLPNAGTRLAAPTHLTATAHMKGKIDLNWRGITATGGGSVSYQVWRADGTSFKPVATPNGSSYHDGGLKKGVTYRYFVVAIDKNGTTSGPSNIATAVGQ
jgi:hypothetical protein